MVGHRILYVSPEVSPFLKRSSTAEICLGLPKFVKEYGHEIRVIMPKYQSIDDYKYVLRDVIRLKDMPVEVAGVEKVATVKSSFVQNSKVQIYFVEIPGFYKEDTFLFKNGNPRKNALVEVAFFAKAVLELFKILSWYPNIIHTNCWDTAIIHYYLKKEYCSNENYKDIKTLHSIHDLDQFGIFRKSEFEAVGLDVSCFDEQSLLKYAIDDSTIITLDNEEALAEYNKKSFFAPYVGEKKVEIIPHGYDNLVWNPQAKKMKQSYSLETIEQKNVNKKNLTHKKDIEIPEGRPVILINIDKDFCYLDELENWMQKQATKKCYFVLSSLDKDLNIKYKDFDIVGENYAFLNSMTNDDLKNYIAASEFYINFCNRSLYNHRFAISMPFGTIPAGERSRYIDQFISIEEDTENFNSVLVKDIKKDFDNLVDKLISVYNTYDLVPIQKRIMQTPISWEPSVVRLSKIYDTILG